MMTSKIRINKINDAIALAIHANLVDGDVTLSKGRYNVDAKSVMGIFSVDTSTGVTIKYPDEACEFADFIKDYEV